MLARIYQPAPNAMQSGRAGSQQWILEFARISSGQVDPLTGNKRAIDMNAQLDLKFDDLETAVAYAKANNIPHRVIKPKPVKKISRSYADNFAFDRKHPWTH